MLDPREVESFEEWRAKRLTNSQDLSVSAYNAEMEATALAYEQGVKDMADAADATTEEQVRRVIGDSPYRQPGMRGERRAVDVPATTRVTGATQAIPHAVPAQDTDPKIEE